MIAAGGIIVAWLAGVKAKFFTISGLAMLALLPIAISFLKPYQKSRILTFLNPERDPLELVIKLFNLKLLLDQEDYLEKAF